MYGLIRPTAGSQPSHPKKITCVIRASQNAGMPIPSTAVIRTSRSGQRPAVIDARTPRGTPNSKNMAVATTTSSSVAGKYTLMSSITGRRVSREVPRSPRTSRLTYRTYCSRRGRSRPNSFRTASTCSFRADRPAATWAGSDGIMFEITNTRIVSPKMTKMSDTARSATSLTTQSSLLPGRGQRQGADPYARTVLVLIETGVVQ